MQGVLSNVVAGLTIIFTKPFRVGEYVELASVQGQVQTIELFSTTLLHADMSRVVVPNRKIVGEILHNYGTIRQLNLTVGIGYGSDIPRVMALLQAIVATNPRVLKTPLPGDWSQFAGGFEHQYCREAVGFGCRLRPGGRGDLPDDNRHVPAGEDRDSVPATRGADAQSVINLSPGRSFPNGRQSNWRGR